MKKISFVLLIMCSIATSFAQVKRTKPAPVSNPQDTAAVANTRPDAGKRKEMMQELNLSKEQKSKLKEIKQAHKAQLDEVQHDTKLSAEEKKAKLKALKMEQLKKTMAVLNEEQKGKMKAMRKQNKNDGKEEELMEEQQ